MPGRDTGTGVDADIRRRTLGRQLVQAAEA
jgi:hypothetical protein